MLKCPEVLTSSIPAVWFICPGPDTLVTQVEMYFLNEQFSGNGMEIASFKRMVQLSNITLHYLSIVSRTHRPGSTFREVGPICHRWHLHVRHIPSQWLMWIVLDEGRVTSTCTYAIYCWLCPESHSRGIAQQLQVLEMSPCKEWVGRGRSPAQKGTKGKRDRWGPTTALGQVKEGALLGDHTSGSSLFFLSFYY